MTARAQRETKRDNIVAGSKEGCHGNPRRRPEFERPKLDVVK